LVPESAPSLLDNPVNPSRLFPDFGQIEELSENGRPDKEILRPDVI